MSSSLPIPTRKPNLTTTPPSSWSSSSSPSPSKGKAKAPDTTPQWQGETIAPRRPSLLGRDMAGKSQFRVIQLGNGRLVTCVKSSQGFDWNQELFLPSYASEDSSDLETKADPVEDIVLSEEELAVLPQ